MAKPRSREAAFCRYESGEQDFWQLIRAHQAKTVTFNSFQVLSSIARSHDDALHCNPARSTTGSGAHPAGSPWPPLVHRQFADLDQARARDVAAQAQQRGGVHLVVMAEAVGGAQQGVLDLFVQGAGLFLEELLEGPFQQGFR
jgi:hypothetical protein